MAASTGTLRELGTYRLNGPPNPLKKSTVTMNMTHGTAADDATAAGGAYDPRTHDGRAYSLGPAQKVVGGDLRYAYDERPAANVKIGKTADFAEILKEYKQTRGSAAASAKATTPPAAATGAAQSTPAASGPPAGASSLLTAASHLTQGDLPDGPQLGVREVKGATNTHLIGSKHTFIPPDHQLSGEASGSHSGVPSSPGVGPWGSYTLGTVNEYASAKFIGHKEYERAVKGLDSVGSWNRTLQDLTASTEIGRPSRIQSVNEHLTGRLQTLRTVRLAQGTV